MHAKPFTENALETLLALAQSDPEFTEYSNKYVVDINMSEGEQANLVQSTLTALAEDKNAATTIQHIQRNADGMPKSLGGLDVITIVAITFLLRSHIRLHKNTDGGWEFLAEHKPEDSEILKMLLSKLESFFER